MTGTVDIRPLPASHPDPDHGPRRTVAWMVLTMALFLVCLVVWAIVAKLDVAVQGRGAVIAPSRLQEVQSLDGGIVEQMLVVPGQPVKKGQLLAKLDTAQYTALVGESQQHRLAALAGRARMDALLGGGAPQFDEAWRRAAPDLIAKETQLWRDALREYQSNQAAAREAVIRRRGELAEAQSRIESLVAAVKLGEEAFAIEERLFKEGAGARADYLAGQQKVMQLRTELDGLRQSLPRLQAGLAEAQATASEGEARVRAQWGTLRSEFETKASALARTLTGQQDKGSRREGFSPLDGGDGFFLATLTRN